MILEDGYGKINKIILNYTFFWEVEMVSVGDFAPNFTLRADDDQVVSLSDFRGRSVVLYFYPKADTPG